MGKGYEQELEIFDMTDDGRGIARDNGRVVFVSDCVVGDVVRAEIFKEKKRYALGRTLQILKPSEHRVEPDCPYQDLCGGCVYGAVDYDTELKLKEKHVYDKLTRLGSQREEEEGTFVFQPITGMNTPYRYRNKAQMQISTGGNIMRKGGIIENLGPAAVGFYQAKSHQVVDCQDCLLQSQVAAAASEALRQFMTEDHITAWDEKWQQGLLRHMVVRTAFGTGEVMIVLVINGKAIPNVEKLLDMLDDAVAEAGGSLESVYYNINKEKTAQIFGKDFIPLAGQRVIQEVLGDLQVEISPASFYQVNPAMTVALYDKAAALAGLTGKERVLDLYCGVGSIGLWMAKKAKYVIGIESVKEAVVDANRNAVLNGIVNARYITGKAEEVLPAILSGEKQEDDVVIDTIQNADVVILDPPRKGCHPDLLQAVRQLGPERIVYISCDAATLARDIAYLAGDQEEAAGEGATYRLESAAPYDMFPRTGHVETVCLLSKLKTQKHIDIDLNMDELDLTSAEAKATYQAIKDWVKANHGLSVSSLYIAQIKQKYGIIERENYNKSKSEGARVPQCPPEKEKAIEEALKHFKMI